MLWPLSFFSGLCDLKMQMGRSSGFNLGATYSSHRPQQQQQHTPSASGSGGPFSNVNNQDLLHVHGSELFPSSHSSYHSQVFYFTFQNCFLTLWLCSFMQGGI